MTNCTPYKICLNRGSIIRIVETEDRNSEIEKLSPIKVNEIFKTIGAIQAPIISSKNLTREEIYLQAPMEYKSKYVNILFKHRQALSVSKTDLGRAKNYFSYNSP